MVISVPGQKSRLFRVGLLTKVEMECHVMLPSVRNVLEDSLLDSRCLKFILAFDENHHDGNEEKEDNKRKLEKIQKRRKKIKRRISILLRRRKIR